MLLINEIAAETKKRLYLNENLPTFRIEFSIRNSI